MQRLNAMKMQYNYNKSAILMCCIFIASAMKLQHDCNLYMRTLVRFTFSLIMFPQHFHSNLSLSICIMCIASLLILQCQYDN